MLTQYQYILCFQYIKTSTPVVSNMTTFGEIKKRPHIWLTFGKHTQFCQFMTRIYQHFGKKKTNFAREEFGAVQKCTNLVDLKNLKHWKWLFAWNNRLWYRRERALKNHIVIFSHPVYFEKTQKQNASKSLFNGLDLFILVGLAFFVCHCRLLK